MTRKEGLYFYHRFLEMESARNIEAALVELGKAIEADPTNSDYCLIRGRWLYRRGKFEPAILDLTKVTELSSKLNDIVEAHRLLAISHGELGDFSSLVSDLDWLIENDFADDRTYMWRGHQHERSENYPQAILDFTKVLEINPNHEPALTNRAQMHYRMQHYEQADHDLSKLLGIDNQHPNALKFGYHWRGMARYQMGKTQDALDDFNEVMRIRGDKPVEDASEYLTLSSDSSWWHS
jgi:tetratricopeptide (TPR) repeat protein